MDNAAADPKRRTESIHVCLTLDRLKEKLLELGYELSRSALYTRYEFLFCIEILFPDYYQETR